MSKFFEDFFELLLWLWPDRAKGRYQWIWLAGLVFLIGLGAYLAIANLSKAFE